MAAASPISSQYVHTALVEWRQYIDVIDTGAAEALAVVNQDDAFVARFKMMSIAILDEKVKYGHVHEVKYSRVRHSIFDRVAKVHALLPRCELILLVRSLPWRTMLFDGTRHEKQNDSVE